MTVLETQERLRDRYKDGSPLALGMRRNRISIWRGRLRFSMWTALYLASAHRAKADFFFEEALMSLLCHQLQGLQGLQVIRWEEIVS